MDWDKAKNIIITFLVLLNIMLGSFIYVNNQKYNLTPEQERNIVTVLAKNNISLYTKPISRYEPMKILEMNEYEFDRNQIGEIFLGTKEAELITANIEDQIEIYDYDNKSLYFFENTVIYEDLGDYGEVASSANKGYEALCADFIKGMGNLGAGFALDAGPYKRGEETIVEYRQKMDNYIIYDNYIMFAVDENYIIRRIEFSKGIPVGYSANVREICSSDEALFSFIQAMKHRSAETPQRIIEKMDIVYYNEPGDQEKGLASPYYRIYYTESGSESTLRLCMVNAYLNTWKIM